MIHILFMTYLLIELNLEYAKPNINDENYRKVFKDSQYEFSTFVDTDENAIY